MLRDRLGVSERWACRVVGQHRSTQRREPVVAGDDQPLRAALREIAAKRPRWGDRRAHARLIELGGSVNRKRVQRLWRGGGPRGAPPRGQGPRLGGGTRPPPGGPGRGAPPP